MPQRQRFNPEARGQHRGLADAHEHIGKVDEILTELPDDIGGRKRHVRALLRTIGRLLDEGGTRGICAERAPSDERTNRDLRAVLNALALPADRRAFDVNTDVQTLVASEEFKMNDVTRERLRHLRDVLNRQDLDDRQKP